jgi:hypothetical protein
MSLLDPNYPSGSTNFGWNLGAQAPPNPAMPMPQPYSQPSYHTPDDNNSDPGVEENAFQAKQAGAMSFAHYIVHFVSD